MSLPSIASSDLSQSVLVDGLRFEIRIRRTEGQDFWVLEVLNCEGKSFIWDDPFATDKAALDAVVIAFEKDGAAGFR